MRSYFIFILVLLQSAAFYSQTVTIQVNSKNDYFVDVLKNALSYSPEKGYNLSFYQKNIPKTWGVDNIANNNGIVIVTGGVTYGLEQSLKDGSFERLLKVILLILSKKHAMKKERYINLRTLFYLKKRH